MESGKVIGETEKMLSQYGQLDGDKITYKIPYPIAMDSLIKQSGDVTKESMDSLIKNKSLILIRNQKIIRMKSMIG